IAVILGLGDVDAVAFAWLLRRYGDGDDVEGGESNMAGLGILVMSWSVGGGLWCGVVVVVWLGDGDERGWWWFSRQRQVWRWWRCSVVMSVLLAAMGLVVDLVVAMVVVFFGVFGGGDGSGSDYFVGGGVGVGGDGVRVVARDGGGSGVGGGDRLFDL
ncbi:Hypothetical predicted protein, partial [Olea europaea subsp. europaea]